MENFKNSIVIDCVCIAILVLESIFMASQTTPALILNLCSLIFFVTKCIGATALVFAIITDFKNYIKYRY
ncbi:MAG: hypothetical protein RSD77_10000 [Romboutsia sp.]